MAKKVVSVRVGLGTYSVLAMRSTLFFLMAALGVYDASLAWTPLSTEHSLLFLTTGSLLHSDVISR